VGIAHEVIQFGRHMRHRGMRTTTTTIRAGLPLLRLISPKGRADPYPFYGRVRSIAPVVFTPPHNWFVTRYRDAEAVLRDPRFASDLSNRALSPRRAAAAAQQEESRRNEPTPIVRDWMLFKDGDDHTRLRTLVGKAFTRRMVEDLRPRVLEIVDELLSEATASGSIELIEDFARPLPVTVICELMGIPPEDRGRFPEWSRLLARSLDPSSNAEAQDEIIQAGNRAALGFTEYFTELIGRRKAEPGRDLLSALIDAQEGGERLTESELLSMCVLLLVAGHGTTLNLIGNGMLALLRHPDQLDLLRRELSLIPNAVEELLRYDSPVQGSIRVPITEVDVAGNTIPAGEDVFVLIASANRDPDRFEDPDHLDVTRKDIRHLAFSGGPHFCLGAPLARLEAQIAFEQLIRRFPCIRAGTDQPAWRETFTIRGLRALPLELEGEPH
jgi:cytochrome P450